MDKEKEKKLQILFFLIILLWQISFNFVIFPQRLFLKYPLNALKFFSKLEPSERFLDFSPLYLFLNGIFILISKNLYIIIPYIQILLGTISLYIFFKWSFKIKKGITSYLIIILVSLYPAYCLYLNCFEPEGLISFSLILGICLLLSGEKVFLTGIFFTINFLLRPSLLPLSIIAFFFIKNKKMLFLIPNFLGVLLLLVFSYWATGHPTLNFMSPGTVFYEGNSPDATGVAAVYPRAVKLWEAEYEKKEADFAHAIYRKISQYETEKNISLIQNQFFWFKKALSYIKDYPLKWFLFVLKKIYFYVSNGEAHDIFSLIIINEALGLFKFISFPIFTSLAILGFLYKRREIPLFIKLIFIFNLFMLSVFYFSSRQRISLFSIIIFLSFYGILAIFEKKIRIILFLFFVAIFSIKAKEVKEYNKTFQEIRIAGEYRGIAKDLLEEKKYSKASITLSISIGIAPYVSYIHSMGYLPFLGGTPYYQALNSGTSGSYFSKGLLYFYDGQTKVAEKFFEKIKDKKIQKHYYDQNLPAYYYIISLWRENKKEKAKEELKKAIERFPCKLSLMALDYILNGKEIKPRYYDLFSIKLKLAETYFFLRDWEKALFYSKEVIKIAPEISLSHEICSISYAYLGNFREMTQELNSIMVRKNLIVFHREWQDIVKKLEEKFGSDKNFTEFINYLRTLFPKPLP